MDRDRTRQTAERLSTGTVEASDGARIGYVRVQRPWRSTGTPVAFLPGGPGLGSILMYHSFRQRAAARGLDVLMMEHRGVGLSRHHTDGSELEVADVTVEAAADDLAAVLDREQIDTAAVYGTSYGSYLAQMFGVRHASRVSGMVLDSPVMAATDRDDVRHYRRELLLHGPGRLPTLVREAVAADLEAVSHVVQVVYEFAGPATLERLLAARLQGRARHTWRRVASMGRSEIAGEGTPFIAEFDLVAGITHGTLGFGADPDGLPLDPQVEFAAAAATGPPFTGDNVDFPSELPGFSWPTAVVSGQRDLRTPRPVAERAVSLLPDAVLVPLAETGHSSMDTHQLAALHVAHHVERENLDGLSHRTDRIAQLPRTGASGKVGLLIRAAVAVEAR